MKYIAEIDIMLLRELPDPQGETVARTLKNIHIEDIEQVRIGKHISMTLEADSEEEARKKTDDACQKLLANQIMETYSFFIHKEEEEEGNNGEVLDLSELGEEGNLKERDEEKSEEENNDEVLDLPILGNEGSNQENEEVLHLPDLDEDSNNKETEEPPLT